MKISEIAKIEKDNENVMLHKEGMFWRAYEKSAYLFVINIKGYSVLHKYYKNIGQDVVYIGFPDTYLGEITEMCCQKKFPLIKTDEKIIEIKGFSGNGGFEEWKTQIITKGENDINLMENDILKQISNFPLASKTPIEAQQFLYNIQNKINGNI
jgi:hypothetical protein